jgi:hypothetical protein
MLHIGWKVYGIHVRALLAFLLQMYILSTDCVPIYQTKSSVMAVLGCNGLRCVTNIILSLSLNGFDSLAFRECFHSSDGDARSSAASCLCIPEID